MPKKPCIQKLVWSLDGGPWCKVSAKPGIDTSTMQYSVDGSPTYTIRANVDPGTLQLSLDGSPWCRIPAKDTINCNPLNYSKEGGPWWAQSICGGGNTEPPTPTAYRIFLGAIPVPRLFFGSIECPKEFLGSIEI
ncbi:MAG: hypothetical protein A2066_12780 [Bacteroidetes bacterium GWB2_41_8]|nr:MAG: hypothetical protein A2066_12780 [Bacteroidetes bacterium GWB2_41_8]